MTKNERAGRLYVAMHRLGLAPHETTALLRIAKTLSRWDEERCNGTIQWDETSHQFYRHHGQGTAGPFLTVKIPNRALSVFNRALKIIGDHPGLSMYHQTDPRGCSLYIYRPVDALKTGHDIHSCYSQVGVAVTID